MKIARLFEIVYILLDRQCITAGELSQRFEVSTRTIYRDVDILSSCGIPIYTNKGKGGGISLIDSFKMDKAMLTVDEQNDILAALQGLRATSIVGQNTALSKLSSFFSHNTTDWIDIDFSFWSNDTDYRDRFQQIKSCIIGRNVLRINYSNTNGETYERDVHPVKLIFKGVSWYLQAYCTSRRDFRVFKLSRITDIQQLDEMFVPHDSIPTLEQFTTHAQQPHELVLLVDASMAYRVYDDFGQGCVSVQDDGSYIVRTHLYDRQWLLPYIMSYGNTIECIAPDDIRAEIATTLQEATKKYL